MRYGAIVSYGVATSLSKDHIYLPTTRDIFSNIKNGSISNQTMRAEKQWKALINGKLIMGIALSLSMTTLYGGEFQILASISNIRACECPVILAGRNTIPGLYIQEFACRNSGSVGSSNDAIWHVPIIFSIDLKNVLILLKSKLLKKVSFIDFRRSGEKILLWWIWIAYSTPEVNKWPGELRP